MTDIQERTFGPTEAVALETVALPAAINAEAVPQEISVLHTDLVPQAEASGSEPSEPRASEVVSPSPAEVVPAEVQSETLNGEAEGRHWHAEAGRKGAHRIHQLIKEGKLYEQEHGLKSGRQRLRQLIELGKLYEEEHGLRPSPAKKRGERLSKTEREELLATFFQCLLRIAKPSFRAELVRLVEVLQEEKEHAA